MSGFEVAGVVLGVLPLVIDALAAYRADAGPFATLRKFRGLLDDLIHQLKTHRTHFYLDIRELLREARVRKIIEDGEPTEELCIAVLKDARTADNVKKYLGHLYRPFREILGYYESCLVNITSKLENLFPHHITANGSLNDLILGKSNLKVPSSVRARLKFTIDRRSLDMLVKDLQTERYSLGKVIKGVKSQRDWEAAQPSSGSSRMAKLFTQVQNSASSLYRAVCQNWACDRHERHQMMIRLENRISAAPRMAQPAHIMFHLCLPLEETLLQEVQVKAQIIELDDEEVEISQTQDISDDPDGSSQQAGGLPTITVTATHCNVPLPAQIRTASNMCDHAREACDEGRILGLELTADILGLNAGITLCQQSFRSTMTLADLLAAASRDQHARMALRQQTLLALDVATAVLQLCQTSWYGAPWSSQEIKFLVEGDGTVVVRAPYVEKMIDAALLPARAPAASPSTQATKAAVLELAILMLEILHHKSIEAWTTETQQGGISTFWERFQVATCWVEVSTEKLLPNHLKAVETCLAQCVKGNLAWNNEFQLLYCENVIQPLQQLVSPG